VLPGSNESKAELFERIRLFRETVKSESELPIVVFSHSNVINAFKSSKVNEDGKLDVTGHVYLGSVHQIDI
jgi:broad specificity phosphatase PhoE